MLDRRPSQIVVVDDEEHICNIINEALVLDNYDVVSFSNPEEAIEYIRENPVDLVLSDLVMGNHSGVHLLNITKEYHKDAIVILMTAHPTVETAISVLKNGAYDFMVKPFKLDLLRATVERGLEHKRVVNDNVHLKDQVEFLKVANAGVDSNNIESFMELLVESCHKELSAQAVAVYEIDPETKEIGYVISRSFKDDLEQIVTDKKTVDKYINAKYTKPRIEKKDIEIDSQKKTRIFISQPIYSRRKLYGLINILVISRFDELTSGQLNVLTLLSNSAAATFSNFNLYKNLRESYLLAFQSLANAIEARDPYTAGHTERVCLIAEMIALELGWNEQKIHFLRIGCTLHDIGKIGVPDSILNKPGPLTASEKKKMDAHPKVGLKIIKGIKLFKGVEPYISAHHEWYNGTGYPKQLKGENIPIEGRLLSVADTFDAILSDRPYRKGASLSKAVAELIKFSSIQFDPQIVDAFIRVIQKGKLDFNELYGRDEDIKELEEILAIEKEPV